MSTLRNLGSLPQAPPPYKFDRAVLFAVGIGAPMLLALAVGEPRAALFAGVGALFALMTDPRRSIAVRVVSVLIALGLIVGAGTLGVLLQQQRVAVFLAVVVITFLSGLPKPYFPYLTIVGKLCAAVVIVTSAGFAATPAAAGAFVGGGLAATLATVVVVRWRDAMGTALTPYDEVSGLLAGERNPLYYAIALAVTVALALGRADRLDATLPGWVGLTVLFVMHPDDATALKLMVQRLGGTLVGIAIAGIFVHWVHDQWWLAALVIGLAALMPKATAVNYFWMCTVFTSLVMLLLDLSLLATGGDATLLLWRFYDTLLGCAVAGAVLLVLYGAQRWREQRAATGIYRP
ncbi:MAG: FUSC family protein [Casimicrobiaceae bacterium]